MNQDIREQLSALIDNELDRDRARFLLKRAEHDTELVALWQRWHYVGESMRGSALPLRKDFARSIMERIDDETAKEAVPSRHPRVLRWGGGFAVAASVAMAALLLMPADTTVSPADQNAQFANEPIVAAGDTTVASVVAPSPYREQDLRPPYRFDAQTVAAREAGQYGMQVRFDPGHESYWLRHQHALNDRANESLPWLTPLRPDVAERAVTH